MSQGGLASELAAALPELRGRLTAQKRLGDITWFRVGGPAEVLFAPADEGDLAYFLKTVGADVPVTVIGLGSNLLVRDGGIDGVVVRLGRGFSQTDVEPDHRLRVGTALPDANVARAAAAAGIAGLAFYRGIPGCIGGALRMNAGAHGSETKDVLFSARAIDRHGVVHDLANDDMGFAYRHCAIAADWIFTQAVYQGMPGDPQAIQNAMQDVADYREAHQPITERTGGSTFRNPPDNSAWKLIDAAGCRGLRVGGAMVSEKHCNFLINTGDATAEDVERLGETVRARVRKSSGVDLHWEIIRLGKPAQGHPSGEALALAS